MSETGNIMSVSNLRQRKSHRSKQMGFAQCSARQNVSQRPWWSRILNLNSTKRRGIHVWSPNDIGPLEQNCRFPDAFLHIGRGGTPPVNIHWQNSDAQSVDLVGIDRTLRGKRVGSWR